MALSTPQQQIELFHLIFLRHLGDRIDKMQYALKGGCNLRFYCKSIRYSEDIDLDVRVVAKDTLKAQVSKLLASSAFQQVLKTRNLSLLDVNPVKQTDTTQRWKLKVLGPATRQAVPTKIEFSRRKMKDSLTYGPVDPEIIASYSLYPVLCNHYTLGSALAQKIEALIDRTETQARDVFDIHQLLLQGANAENLSGELRSRLSEAIENTMSISYGDYKGQVVSYLKSEYQDDFGKESYWGKIQEKIIQIFESSMKGRG